MCNTWQHKITYKQCHTHTHVWLTICYWSVLVVCRENWHLIILSSTLSMINIHSLCFVIVRASLTYMGSSLRTSWWL